MVSLRPMSPDRIQLHAFGPNAVARKVYTSVGYVETDVQMEKRIN